MARRLIEQHRRRADFQADNCTPIVLADGHSWMIQRPWLEVIPHFHDGQAVDCTRMPSQGDLDPLLEQIGAEDDGLTQAMLVLTLGALLLQRSYDVTDAELGRLFVLRPGDPDSDRMLREIIEVATGNAIGARGWSAVADPKAPDDGSEAA